MIIFLSPNRLSNKQDLETTLYHLPKPNKHHLDLLNALLREVDANFVLSEEDVAIRERVATIISDIVSVSVPGCFVRLYGSCYSGFGLKDSVLNLDLLIPEEMRPHIALQEVLRTVCTTKGFR